MTVVIPAYNAAPWLGRAIQSCLAQQAGSPEIIVIDDGSADETSTIARAFGPPVCCFWQENAGVSAARNHGLRLARNQFVAFLDADDELLPRMTQVLMKGFDRFPHAGASSGPWFHCHPDGRNRVPPEGCVLAGRPGPDRVGDFYRTYNRNPFVRTGSALFRKDVLDQIGGFCESLSMGEDLEYWMRIAGACEWVYTDTPVKIYNHFPASSVTLKGTRIQNVDWLYDEDELARWVPEPMRDSYRMFRRDEVIRRAKGMLVQGAVKEARAALRAASPAPMNKALGVMWLLSHLPGPLAAWLAKRTVETKALVRRFWDHGMNKRQRQP